MIVFETMRTDTRGNSARARTGRRGVIVGFGFRTVVLVRWDGDKVAAAAFGPDLEMVA